MTGTYETTDTHLLLHGPGVFELSDPWNETVEVEEGKTRQRKLPETGPWEPPTFGQPAAAEIGEVTVRRRLFIGLKKIDITPSEDSE